MDEWKKEKRKNDLELQLLVTLEFGIQFRPATRVLLIETEQIDRHQLGIVFFQKHGNGIVQLAGFESFRKFTVNGTIFVLDAHNIAKSGQHFFLATHQPSLKQMVADAAAGSELKGFVDPSVLIGQRFAFDEDGSQFALAGKGRDCGLVDFAVLVAEPVEHLSHQFDGE